MLKRIITVFLVLFHLSILAQSGVKIPTDYTAIDQHVKETPKEATESIEKLAEYLTSSSSDPFLRLRAIYQWTNTNIEYEWFQFIYMEHLPVSAIPKDERTMFTGFAYKMYAFSLNTGLKKLYKLNSSEKMLKRKKGICHNYSQFINDLCFEAGIKSLSVNGYMKTNTFQKRDPLYSSNHSWNVAAISREWHMFDATNGLWITDKDSIKKYMLPADPIWQLKEEPISVEEFSADSVGEYYWDPYDYMDSITFLIGKEPIEIALQSAINSKRFNMINNKDLAYAYYNHANYHSNKAKTTKNDYEEVLKAYTTAKASYDSAKVYFKHQKKLEIKEVGKRNKERIKAAYKIEKEKLKTKVKAEKANTKQFERDKKDYLKLVKAKYKTLIDSVKTRSNEHVASMDPTQKIEIKKVKTSYKIVYDSLKIQKANEVAFIERYNEEQIKAYQKEQSKKIKDLEKKLKTVDKRNGKILSNESRRLTKEKKQNAKFQEESKKMSKYCKDKHKKLKNAYYK